MNKTFLWIGLVLAIAIVGSAFLFMIPGKPPSGGSSPSATTSPSVMYTCAEGATIQAAYASSSVTLTLSDGRALTLPQTMSGSGIRYEAGSGTSDDVVFTSKGADAYLMENGSTTYTDCVANSAAAAAGPNASTRVFTDQGNTFSFNDTSQFSVTGGGMGYTTQWMQNTTSSGLILAKLAIPASFEPGTNFAGATLTVGTSPDPAAVAACLTQTNGNVATTTQTMINGAPFTEITYGDAGAGNFYRIVSYRTIRNDQCYALEYVIHSTDIQNYPAGTVTVFNENAVDAILNGIVQSFHWVGQ